MFNFIITGTCSKGCSFCFTEEVARLKHSLGEMSVDQLNKLLDYYEFSPIKGEFSDVRILGGEPTQHSNFQGIADAVILRGLKINFYLEKLQKNILLIKSEDLDGCCPTQRS